MGINIHIHQEVKIPTSPEWQHYRDVDIAMAVRWPALYDFMAGTRDGKWAKPLCEPKGLPDDITDITKFAYALDSYHHASWFGFDEMKQVEEWFTKLSTTDQHYGRRGFYNYFGSLFGNGWRRDNGAVTDARWVFWFDN